MITMKRKIVEGITVKRVRPEGGIYEQCSDMLLNWRDMRSEFGYKLLYTILLGGYAKMMEGVMECNIKQKQNYRKEVYRDG
jgi:hypothetical protein